MANRWKTATPRVKKSCAFGAGVAAVVAFACLFCPPVQAVLFGSITSASGSDYVVANGFVTWQASNGPVNTHLLAPGQETVYGAEGWNMLGTGQSSFDQQNQLDTRETIVYNSAKSFKWAGLGTASDSASVMNMLEPVSEDSGDCYQGWNATGLNEKASQQALVIGRNSSLDSAVSIQQLDTEIPDTLEITQAATGNGFATITSSAQSQVGYLYTQVPAWQHDQFSKVSGAGNSFAVGKKTTWRSFKNLFNSTFEAD
jgi:hypothetical protein